MQSNVKQSKAMQCNAKQSNAMHSKAKQSKVTQRKVKESKAKQCNTKLALPLEFLFAIRQNPYWGRAGIIFVALLTQVELPAPL